MKAWFKLLALSALFFWSCSESRPSKLSTARSALTSYQRVVVDSDGLVNPWMKSIADFNNDGLPDLMVANDVGNIVWYENPTWTRRVLGNGGPSDSASAVGDLDRDGDEDAVVGQFWYENINLGSSFTLHWFNPVGLGTHDAIIVDINHDGKPDVVSRGENLATIRVYLQQGTASDYQVFELEPGVGRNGLDVADVNRDGHLDVVVGGVWMECPAGDIATATWTPHTFASWNNYASVVVHDMNRDGQPDIVLGVSEETGNLSWFEAPSWAEHVIDTGLTNVHNFVVADIDHNGKIDVAASEFEGPGRFIMYLNQGASWTSTVIATDAIHNLRGADLNNDGTIDFFGAGAWGQAPVIAYLSESCSCSGTGGAGGASTGGAPATGGASTGGVPTGGAPTGGAPTGGVPSDASVDASDSSAGGSGTGGAPSTGGAPETGGASTGGAPETGGAPDTGGAPSTGGAPTTIYIGEQSVLSTDDYGNGGLVVSQPADLAQGATVQSISFRVNTAAGLLRMGIYDSNASGNPRTLMAATAEFAPVVGWNTEPVVAPISLAPGKYWLAYAPSSDGLHFASQPGGVNAAYFSRPYQPLPATFSSSPTFVAWHWSFYATLTVP